MPRIQGGELALPPHPSSSLQNFFPFLLFTLSAAEWCFSHINVQNALLSLLCFPTELNSFHHLLYILVLIQSLAVITVYFTFIYVFIYPLCYTFKQLFSCVIVVSLYIRSPIINVLRKQLMYGFAVSYPKSCHSVVVFYLKVNYCP